MKNPMIREAWDAANPTQQQRERMRAALAARVEAADGKKNGKSSQEEPVYFDFTLPAEPYAVKLQEETPQKGKKRQKEEKYSMGMSAKTNWPGYIAAIAALLVLTISGGLFLAWMSSRTARPSPVAAPEGIAQEYLELLDQYEAAIKEAWRGERYAAEDMSVMLQDVTDAGKVGYVLRDLNGDGEDELFLTNGDMIYDLYTLYGGELSHIFSSGEKDTFYLTNGSFFSEVSSGSDGVRYDAVWYLRGKELAHGRYTLTYDPNRSAEASWFMGEQMEPLTEKNAQGAIDTYPHAAISFTPLSGKRVREQPEQPDDALLKLYAEKLPEAYQEYTKDAEKTFCFYDYDGDGTLELLLGAGDAIYRVLQPAAGDVNQVEICQAIGGQKEIHLCEGYVLEAKGEYGDSVTYNYHRVGDPFLSGFCILYTDAKGEITCDWVDPNDMHEGTVTRDTITEEEAQKIMQEYPRLSLDWKPISDFPVPLPDLDSRFRTGIKKYDNVIYKYENAILSRWDSNRCRMEDISQLTAEIQSTSDLGYTLLDLNGDGNNELLITDGDIIYGAYSCNATGLINHFESSGRSKYYLSDDNLIPSVSIEGDQITVFICYRWDASSHSGWWDADLDTVSFLAYDPVGHRDRPWINSAVEDDGTMPRFTDAEAKAIMDKYPHREIEFTPLSGKTAESKDDPASDEGLMALYRESIGDVQTIYKGLHPNSETELSYCFYDSDGDGKEELLLGAGNSVYRILQPMTGMEEFIDISAPTGEEGSAFLCEGNVFECVFYADGDYYNRYYRIGDADGSMDVEEVECICLKADSDTWYVGVKNPAPKTEEEVEQVREKYPHVKLDWKGLSQFPKPAVTKAGNADQLKTGVQDFDAILESHDYMIRNKWTADQVANAKRNYNAKIYEDNVQGQLGWCMYDVTGDGKEDLLIGTDTFLYEIYSGETKEDILSHYYVVSLREGNVLLRHYIDSENTTWMFYKIKDEQWSSLIQSVTFNSKEQTFSAGTDPKREKPISKDEASEIIESKYPKLELEMKLLPAAAEYGS